MSINLLPWREIKAKRTIKIYQYALVISLITLLTASLAIRALIQYKASLKLVDNKQITHLIALKKKRSSLKKMIQDKKDANQNLMLSRARIAHLVKMLRALAMCLPKNATLSSITLNNQTLIINGYSMNIENINAYIKSLLSTHSFNVALIKDIIYKNHKINFVIKAT